jgi:hypothetical protein
MSAVILAASTNGNFYQFAAKTGKKYIMESNKTILLWRWIMLLMEAVLRLQEKIILLEFTINRQRKSHKILRV